MPELPEPLHDAELIRLQRAGNERDFDMLYRAYFPRLVRVSRRLVKEQAAAEDIAQEALLRALTYLSSFDATKPMWPWLKTIARRIALDHMARSGREATLGGHDEPNSDDTMPDLEERSLLEVAMAGLSRRHRIALQLRYLEDWGAGQAASFLGMSAPAFRQLLARARARLRAEYRRAGGILGVACAPFRWVWDMGRRASDRVEAGARFAPPVAWTVPADTLHQVMAGMVALALAVGGLDIGAREHRPKEVRGGPEAIVHAAVPTPVPTPAPAKGAGVVATAAGGSAEEAGPPADGDIPQPPGGNGQKDGGADEQEDTGPAPTEVVEEPVQATQDYAPETAEEVSDPNEDVEQPEDAQLTSIAGPQPEPGAKSEAHRSAGSGKSQVLLAAGTSTCQRRSCPYVLFRSEDGGATWSKLQADGFRGEQLLLPPDFDRGDDRIFAMGPVGLQVSEDGGVSFRSAVRGAPSPVGTAAISPGFSSGDPSILVGGTVLHRYDASSESIEPIPVHGAQGPFHPAYSPDYLEDGLIYLGGSRFEVGYGMTASISRCGEKGCTHASLRGQVDLPQIVFGSLPESGYRQIYSFTLGALFSSSDLGLSFEEMPQAMWTQGQLRDVESIDEAMLIAAVGPDGGGKGEGLYLSQDGGSSWRLITSPALTSGPMSTHVEADRLLVTLEKGGFVCSEDVGETWHERCP